MPGTKAFCSECGAAMVDEDARKHATEHESYQETMRLTKSGYNLMLADMGLNISDAPNMTSERINLSKEFRDSLPLMPLTAAEPAAKNKKWLIVSIVCALILLLVGLGLLLFFLRPLFSAH